ncbi:hypothetical protein D6C86_10454 [Aureobasidium pullulans]|uniref:Uncharacterized protein n=1 Tax=Aureobasidium pullulans TaxID=5580 RepID=A0A4V4LDG1_AURPU|nr:hypothetical protein D6C97_09889 [Aureobasidium pullulans]THY67908.1 hypothetical protein D6C94_10481 [Aureobasidium pullulans]THZ35104.1 hypothetical protein D6C87_10033 [Aureobasidium pullulans]THZ51614.1 hypothetical protein D6C86_10454 [Aureobasidium pullulans]THZ63322.1 hypothetical protein D6C88_08505 [Aureobasidium pullulans]
MKISSTIALVLLSGAAMVAATPISSQTHSAPSPTTMKMMRSIATRPGRHIPVMTIIGTDSEGQRTTSAAVDVAPTSTSIGRGIPVVPVHHAEEKEKEGDIGSAIPYVPIHHEDDGGLAFPVVPVDHHTTRTTTGTSHLPKASAFHKRSGQ